MGIRGDHHCQYLMYASLKYGRIKLSVMCGLLCLQLWAITTSFLLQGTSKLHARFLVLLLRLAGLAQVYLDDFTSAPSFYPGCTHTYLRQFSSRSSLTLFNGCFLSRIRIRVCVPPLLSCRSYVFSGRSTTRSLSLTDSHVVESWVHMLTERFCP